MGTSYAARFADGTERDVASMGWANGLVFYEMTRTVERLLSDAGGPHASGLSELDECATYWIDADTYLKFCDVLQEQTWLSHEEMIWEWMRRAGGMWENITLLPCEWTTWWGDPLETIRYSLEPELEQRLQERITAYHSMKALAGNKDDAT